MLFLSFLLHYTVALLITDRSIYSSLNPNNTEIQCTNRRENSTFSVMPLLMLHINIIIQQGIIYSTVKVRAWMDVRAAHNSERSLLNRLVLKYRWAAAAKRSKSSQA